MGPLRALVRRHPWVANVAAYGTLFSAADVAQQVLARPKWDLSGPQYLDLKQTGKVALVGFTFHANFNYIWFRTLERLLPGVNVARVIAKVACDQAIAAPITIGAFYTGLSLLDGESDVFGNLRAKFWPTYKAGVVCWSVLQAVNFTLVPPMLRTTYAGACSFLWTAFLCYLRQNDAQDTTARIFRALPVKSTVDDLVKEVRSRTEELARSTLKDQALLDQLVEFRKKTTMKLKVALKEHQTKACDKANCEWLRYSVLDCVGCKDINAVCYTIHQCFVDSQDRVSLRYGPVRWDPKIAQNGVAIVLCMGGVLFLVIVGVILKYWRNRLYLYV